MAAAALLAVAPFGLHAGERLAADVHCTPAGERYVYDCMIMLKGKKSGAPVTGATLTVNANMPSMTMAHNVPPVTGMPTGKPGAYNARLELTMHGEWAFPRCQRTGPRPHHQETAVRRDGRPRQDGDETKEVTALCAVIRPASVRSRSRPSRTVG